MAKLNLSEYATVRSLLAPTSSAVATTYSTGTDTKGYSSALIIVHIGLANTDAELDVNVFEGDAVSSDRAVIAGSSFTQMAAANDNTVFVGYLDLQPRKRYIAVKASRDGTNIVNAGVSIVLFRNKVLPVTQTNTVPFTLLT